MGSIIGILSLIIYFIWGQGTACAWWMWIPIILLIVCIVAGQEILNWIISLFLLGVTFFAPPTFGYNDVQKGFYYDGYHFGETGLFQYDAAWYDRQLRASIDVDSWEKYFRYGFKRGASGKKN
ncbi:MAG: hypothetical protein HDR86_03750 [Bacteroides sp.]|nr:hypothetical protein [Bacteroides sp.]